MARVKSSTKIKANVKEAKKIKLSKKDTLKKQSLKAKPSKQPVPLKEKKQTRNTKAKDIKVKTKVKVAVKQAKKEVKKVATLSSKIEVLNSAESKFNYSNPPKNTFSDFRAVSKRILSRLETAPKAQTKNKTQAKNNNKKKKFRLDLRIHSSATQGFHEIDGVSTLDALPGIANVKGLDLIAITDFYSYRSAFQIKNQAIAKYKGKLSVLPGFTFRTRVNNCDEVYLVAIFDENFSEDNFDEIFRKLSVPKSAEGDSNYILELDLQKAIKIIEARGGVVFPSRVDKNPYRELAIKSLIEDYGFRSFDLVYPEQIQEIQNNYQDYNLKFFTFSNAYSLGMVGSRTSELKLPERSFKFIKEEFKRFE